MYKKFALAYLAEDFGEDEENELREEESDDEEKLEQESKAYIVFTRAMAAMCMFPEDTKLVIGGALIDTVSNVLSSVCLPLLSAGRVANMRNTQPKMGDKLKRLGEIEDSVRTLGTLMFHSRFGGKAYLFNLSIFTGSAPLIIYHKDLYIMGLNFQILKK